MKKLLLALVVLSSVAYIVVRRGGSDQTATETKLDANVALDRIWIDHIPRNDRDTFSLFAAITEQPFGIFQATSQWKGQYELFQYEAHGDEIRFHYGQTGDREKAKIKATKCSEKGFDYCLTIDGASRGVKKYYSMEEWIIEGNGTDTIDHLRKRVNALVQAKQQKQ
jgi:hypothetical protein